MRQIAQMLEAIAAYVDGRISQTELELGLRKLLGELRESQGPGTVVYDRES